MDEHIMNMMMGVLLERNKKARLGSIFQH